MPAVYDPTQWFWYVNDNAPATTVWTNSGGVGGSVGQGSVAFQNFLNSGGPEWGSTFQILSAASNGAGGTRFTMNSTGAAPRQMTSNQFWTVRNTGLYDGIQQITVIDATHLDIAVAFTATCTGQVSGATIIDTLNRLLTEVIDANNQTIQPPIVQSLTGSGTVNAPQIPPGVLVFTPSAPGATLLMPFMNATPGMATGRQCLIINGSATNSFNLGKSAGAAPRYPKIMPNMATVFTLIDNLSAGGNTADRPFLEIDYHTNGDSNATLTMGPSLITEWALYNLLTAPRTWTMPSTGGFQNGALLLVVDVVGGISSTNTLTLARTGLDNIDGGTSVVLNRPFDQILFMADVPNTCWKIIAGKNSLKSTDLGDLPIPLSSGGTAADLSATGGAHQFLRQNSAGAAITVVQPASTDLSDLPIPVSSGGTAYAGGALPAYTATLTSSAGAITTQSSDSASLQIGKIVLIEVNITVTTAGTGAGGTCTFNLPVACKRAQVLSGRMSPSSFKSIYAVTQAGSATAGNLFTSDGVQYTLVTGDVFRLTGWYEAQ